ncbi:YdiU family protein [Permianibacter sp. IMCC34836]|uniref:protein adenylyltransferase SelO n=1 Tax=Permianibacter fluminis TaxID=2738515 RepID=UPI001556712C|nr:YdiU family protein [Permianibacter fluminis]NQD38523.1 YdiU family protein [Permianibacter fluminis]
MARLEDLNYHAHFAALAEPFSVPVTPTPLASPQLVAFSADAAALIDLDPSEAERPAFADLFAGAASISGWEPRAMVYAGHQFGVYVPRLGDGRALLLAEVRDRDGGNWQLHLKGAGATPFSRMGDGRAVLRSSIREFLCSEAMHALGIPTTRALCVIGSGETVYRETPEKGATVLRLAPSHTRFGTFQYFAMTNQHDALKRLLEFTIAEHFPQHRHEADAGLRFFRDVVRRTAGLLAQWQAFGFAHGVMNTDNMSVLGLTLDYGPFGFMDRYNPAYICNHSDTSGRYAFDEQPTVALWNLCRFAEALLPLLDREQLAEALAEFEPQIIEQYSTLMRGKLGLTHPEDDDRELSASLLQLMAAQGADYPRSFRALSQLTGGSTGSSVLAGSGNDDRRFLDEFADREAAANWLQRWRARLAREGSIDLQRQAIQQRHNPKYVLRNYLAQQAIAKAEAGDFSEVQALHALLRKPFDEQPEHERYAALPPDWSRELEISCSS